MPHAQRDTNATRSAAVKSFALQLGFDACGIASAGTRPDPLQHMDRWLGMGYHATMSWLGRTAQVRSDVRLKLPGARSVVVVARNYFYARPAGTHGAAKVARYAWGRDYHKVMRRPLIRLAGYLDDVEPGAKSYASIDTGPVMERAWAARSGVASVGKHSLGIRRDLGSWFFLATVVTTVELEEDAPAQDLCGTCTLCIDACPTQAIVEPYVVDSRRCISYQTIENRGEIPATLHASQGEWVFGCDACQEVCPWNRFARESSEAAFRPQDGQANPDASELAQLTPEEFDARFAGTAIRRAKHAGMQRNARIVVANERALAAHETDDVR